MRELLNNDKEEETFDVDKFIKEHNLKVNDDGLITVPKSFFPVYDDSIEEDSVDQSDVSQDKPAGEAMRIEKIEYSISLGGFFFVKPEKVFVEREYSTVRILRYSDSKEKTVDSEKVIEADGNLIEEFFTLAEKVDWDRVSRFPAVMDCGSTAFSITYNGDPRPKKYNWYAVESNYDSLKKRMGEILVKIMIRAHEEITSWIIFGHPIREKLDENKYRERLHDMGYESSSVKTCISNTDYIRNFLAKQGIDLNSAVFDAAFDKDEAKKILLCLEENGEPYYHIQAFKKFYYLSNKQWIDDWRPRKKRVDSEKKKTETKVSVKKAPIGEKLRELKLPKAIDGYEESEGHPFIVYEENISEEEKIPGLVGFLTKEYEAFPEIIREIITDVRLREIPVILSKECPYEIYEETDDYIAHKLFTLMRKGRTVSEKQIKDILSEKNRTERIIGRYFPSGFNGRDMDCFRFENGDIPYIKIYYRNIQNKGLEDYKAIISNCLAHEYFHFLHHQVSGEAFSETSSGATIVKEAVADFGAEMFSLYKYKMEHERAVIDQAKRRYDAWCDRYGSSWPYAHALDFYHVQEKVIPFFDDFDDYHHKWAVCREKFWRVFWESRMGLMEAKKILDTL